MTGSCFGGAFLRAIENDTFQIWQAIIKLGFSAVPLNVSTSLGQGTDFIINLQYMMALPKRLCFPNNLTCVGGKYSSNKQSSKETIFEKKDNLVQLFFLNSQKNGDHYKSSIVIGSIKYKDLQGVLY